MVTEHDLLGAVLEHYFSDWEIERAQAVLEKQGMAAAVEYLRILAADSCRGAGGPSMASWQTRRGHVLMWSPGKPYSGEPDYMAEIGKFCRRKLESLHQPKLL